MQFLSQEKGGQICTKSLHQSTKTVMCTMKEGDESGGGLIFKGARG